MSQEAARTTRVEARIAPDALAIVKCAAELQGGASATSWWRPRKTPLIARSRKRR